MKIMGVLFLSVFLISNAYSKSMTRNEVEYQVEVHEALTVQVLSNIEAALVTMGAVISDVTLSDQQGHRIAQKVADQLRGVRSILYVELNGDLKFDGLVWPTPKISLADRVYFKNAKATTSTHLQVDWSVLAGRVTGQPFFPASYTVRRDKEILGVLVAIISPEALIWSRIPNTCSYCVVLLTDLNGDLITKYPVNSDLDVGKISAQTKGFDPNGSRLIYLENGLTAKTAWRRNRRYALTKIFLEIVVGDLKSWQ